MEHIGKHFERAEREKKDLGEGKEDAELRRWALEQRIVVDRGNKACCLTSLQGVPGHEKGVRAVNSKRGKFVEKVEEDAAGDEE